MVQMGLAGTSKESQTGETQGGLKSSASSLQAKDTHTACPSRKSCFEHPLLLSETQRQCSFSPLLAPTLPHSMVGTWERTRLWERWGSVLFWVQRHGLDLTVEIQECSESRRLQVHTPLQRASHRWQVWTGICKPILAGRHQHSESRISFGLCFARWCKHCNDKVIKNGYTWL